MNSLSQEDVTGLLEELRNGNRAALDVLFPQVYEALRELAHRHRRHWQGNYTLNTTALVNEAYLKLVGQTRATWENRAHFFATAAKAMRQILMNYARSRRAQKRGGDHLKLSLDDIKESLSEDMVLSEEGAEALVVLDEALEKLEELSPRQSRIVECRFFAGMSIKETASALGIATATVSRGWKLTQVWLYREMKPELEP